MSISISHVPLGYGGRNGGLMVSALNCRLSNLGTNPDWGHCVLFLGKTTLTVHPLTRNINGYKQAKPLKCWGLTSHPGGKAILPMVSWYGSWDDLCLVDLAYRVQY